MAGVCLAIPRSVQLDAHGLADVELWLTETGVPVCGDSTFPACDDPQNRWFRAAPDEQAAYLIQNLTYAPWLKAETYIWFQLYDDCGNVCGLDAYGLVRNDNTTRTAYQTYQFAVNQSDARCSLIGAIAAPSRPPTGSAAIRKFIAFQRPASGERIVVMWTRYYTNDLALLAATAPSATLYLPNGTSEIIYPISGTYAISLPMATNRNFKARAAALCPMALRAHRRIAAHSGGDRSGGEAVNNKTGGDHQNDDRRPTKSQPTVLTSRVPQIPRV